MKRHPSGKAHPADSGKAYRVKAGDTLWSIAASALSTDDPARIARFWPRLHRMNRAVIGADPNMILPGQVLRLPAEREDR